VGGRTRRADANQAADGDPDQQGDCHAGAPAVPADHAEARLAPLVARWCPAA
jgi:hypothetical protein